MQCSSHSWIARILPNVEESSLYNQFDWTLVANKDPFQVVDTNPNIIVSKLDLPLVRCPSDPQERELPNWGPTNYVACIGNANNSLECKAQGGGCAGCLTQTGAFYINSQWNLAHFRDGTSNTMLISECIVTKPDRDRGYSWAFGQSNRAWAFSTRLAPNDLQYADGGEYYTYTYYSFSAARSNHTGMVQAGFADGSVKPVNDEIDITVWRAAGSIRGGEIEKINSD